MIKEQIEGFTRQLYDALSIGKNTNPLKPKNRIRNIVITGMGGSGIGANVIQSLSYNTLSVPVIINKQYAIPHFVNQHTLYIACSYSGNTEETLSASKEAVAKKAYHVCITSGGVMMAWAKENKIPLMQMPAGSHNPRSMLGYSITLLLQTLHCADLIDSSFIKETEQAIALLDKKEQTIQKQAKDLAKKLKDKIPVLYCEENIHALALRFQNQLNENGKNMVHINTFPEMNHNEIVGWAHPKDIFSRLQVIYLHIHECNKRIKKRMHVCKEIFEKSSGSVIDIVSEGTSLLEQYYYIIHFTDWVSYFMAMENKVDPDPIEAITFLKKVLK